MPAMRLEIERATLRSPSGAWSVLPRWRYMRSCAPNAFSTWAVVPLAMTQRLLAGRAALTSKPACARYARTADTSASVGA
jgi:hypothetical protein